MKTFLDHLFSFFKNTPLRFAMTIGLLGHAITLPFTFEHTYDAFVHIFFADHYAHNWFNLWEDRWYTGFSITTYPPLVHQIIALFSYIGGLKFGFILWAILILVCLIIGIYRFSCLFVSQRTASWAALVGVFTPSIIQAIHIYGQLPTVTGITFLLNSLPDLYSWIRWGNRFSLLRGLALISVTVASHHVTPLFGMVFFIAPLVGVALFDQGEPIRSIQQWVIVFWKNSFRISILFIAVISLLIGVIFPYWAYSSANPIIQVPIPHGSRDSFFNVPSSGLMFFLIPYGLTLFLFPYIVSRYFTKRNFFVGISLLLLAFLGTGGTTPFPRLILGKNAFQILTLDRFTFWATILCIPFVTEWLLLVWAKKNRVLLMVCIVFMAMQTMYIIQMGRFRALQPDNIKMQAIVNFLATDQHSHWRYLTLGFGDQMAWLSTLTPAQSVDGNYHSARSLPELIAYPVERLEGAKHRGLVAIESLQRFIFNPDKYSLKYIFSNDKFYDPLLYFSGWEQVIRLENGIVVWERPDVPPLGSEFHQKIFPLYQQIWWGCVPISFFFITSLILLYSFRDANRKPYQILETIVDVRQKTFTKTMIIWVVVVATIIIIVYCKAIGFPKKNTPEEVLKEYLLDLDFRFFDKSYEHFANNCPNYESYLLQLSVTDGLLASYSKMDSLKVIKKYQHKDTILLDTQIYWRTSLGRFIERKKYAFLFQNYKWKLLYPYSSTALSPDRILESRELRVFSHGKRKISTEPAPPDDILDRPQLKIITANLIKYDTLYAIVGELRNMDYLPASVNLECLFYDSKRNLIKTFGTNLTTIYKILPKETLSFRVDLLSKIVPTDFEIKTRAVVTSKPIYRSIGFQNVSVIKNKIQGNIINHGTSSVTIPAVVSSFYNQAQNLLWVDKQFISEGIRVQKNIFFTHTIPDINTIKIIKVGDNKMFFVNGIPQESAFMEKIQKSLFEQGYFRLKIDPFVANEY